MDFLYARGGVLRDVDVDVRAGAHASPVAARQRDGDQSASLGPCERLLDVCGGAARRNPQRHIACGAERLDLTREDFDISVVVSDGGHDACVGRESQGAQSAALELETADELRGEM